MNHESSQLERCYKSYSFVYKRRGSLEKSIHFSLFLLSFLSFLPAPASCLRKQSTVLGFLSADSVLCDNDNGELDVVRVQRGTLTRSSSDQVLALCMRKNSRIQQRANRKEQDLLKQKSILKRKVRATQRERVCPELSELLAFVFLEVGDVSRLSILPSGLSMFLRPPGR